MIPSGSGRCPENRFRPGSRIVHLPGKTGNRITGIRFRPDTRYFCYDGSFSAALRRGRCRAQLFATKERYRCGLPLAGTHRPLFEPILFFLCQKEKNGFNLPRKESGPVRTVVLNLTLKISDSSCPLHQTLPPERSLRSAHRGVRRRLRIWSFRRPGGNGMELASSDAAAVLFFLRKRKKRMGAQKRADNARPYKSYRKRSTRMRSIPCPFPVTICRQTPR